MSKKRKILLRILVGIIATCYIITIISITSEEESTDTSSDIHFSDGELNATFEANKSPSNTEHIGERKHQVAYDPSGLDVAERRIRQVKIPDVRTVPVKKPPLTPEQQIEKQRKEWVADGWIETSNRNGSMPDCYNFRPRRGDIENYLEVHVGGGTDVVIKVMNLRTETCIRYVYINSKSTYKIYNIPTGRYYLKVAYGKNWFSKTENGQCVGKFLRNPIYEKGSDILNFSVTETEDGLNFNCYTLELDVVGSLTANTFNTHKVSEEEFNK